ncbi:S8 family serine peptidase [Streptomyces sp. SAS_260]|uniref:S8 family serine peptidase n=1 Tax=Streptomyces sp. SAS_260 TaxID=3412751 RepID=UPI00403C0B80
MIAAVSGVSVSVGAGAPGARIMPVRVLGADGTRDPTVIADAVRWAVDHGADVINLSLGDTEQADRLRKFGPLDLALREGDRAVVVAATGNDSQVKRDYRARLAVVVQAVGPDGRLAAFSAVGDPRSAIRNRWRRRESTSCPPCRAATAVRPVRPWRHPMWRLRRRCRSTGVLVRPPPES